MLKSGSKLKSDSWEETLEWGRALGREAKRGDLFCLFGPLGAGKTSLIKGIAEGALGISSHLISSPTFSLLHVYNSSSGISLYHFDLYRLKKEQEFLQLGFEEYLFGNGITCIEWSERIASLLKGYKTIDVRFSFSQDNIRNIDVDYS